MQISTGRSPFRFGMCMSLFDRYTANLAAMHRAYLLDSIQSPFCSASLENSNKDEEHSSSPGCIPSISSTLFLEIDSFPPVVECRENPMGSVHQKTPSTLIYLYPRATQPTPNNGYVLFCSHSTCAAEKGDYMHRKERSFISPSRHRIWNADTLMHAAAANATNAFCDDDSRERAEKSVPPPPCPLLIFNLAITRPHVPAFSSPPRRCTPGADDGGADPHPLVQFP